MEVFTGNDQKDSQMTFEISPSNGGLQELSPSMILLVDDDPDIRSLTRTFLERRARQGSVGRVLVRADYLAGPAGILIELDRDDLRAP